VLLDDVAVARMAAEDAERGAVLSNALVLRRRERYELAAVDVVALAEVRNALERGATSSSVARIRSLASRKVASLAACFSSSREVTTRFCLR